MVPRAPRGEFPLYALPKRSAKSCAAHHVRSRSANGPCPASIADANDRAPSVRQTRKRLANRPALLTIQGGQAMIFVHRPRGRGPSIITWQHLVPGDLGQFAKRFRVRRTQGARSLASAIEPGAQAVAERERHVVGPHDLANIFELLVEEAILVMREAPLGHDRTRRAKRCR